ncbi:H(+)-transporting V1 sector ATPase subunit A [Linnemannia elongata]|nr:H(+)-transporting V1 sector ATPase subunit A [Linnemannia elongata]
MAGDANNHSDPGFAYGTLIRMANGDEKEIQTIQAGDMVADPDSNPRRVLHVEHGDAFLYSIRENRATRSIRTEEQLGTAHFIASEAQKLVLRTRQMTFVSEKKVDRAVRGYVVKWSRLQQDEENRYQFVQQTSTYFNGILNGLPQARTAAEDLKAEKGHDGPFDWEIPIQEYENIQNAIKERTFLSIAPLDIGNHKFREHCRHSGLPVGTHNDAAYLTGLWIGDGTSIRLTIAYNTTDEDEVRRIREVCGRLGLFITVLNQSPSSQGSHSGLVAISADRGHPYGVKERNPFWQLLVRLGMGMPGTKKVDDFFVSEERSVQEHLLCGLLDSDGCKRPPTNQPMRRSAYPMNAAQDIEALKAREEYCQATFVNTNPNISKGVLALTRSLGIKTSVHIQDAEVRRGINRATSSTIALLPCSALSNVLSNCSIQKKQATKPAIVHHCNIDFRFTTNPATLCESIQSLAERHSPHVQVHPTPQARAYVDGFGTETISAIASAFKSFGQVLTEVLPGHSSQMASRFMRSRAVNQDMENRYKDLILHKLPGEVLEEIHAVTQLDERGAVARLVLEGRSKYVLANGVIVC